MKNTKTHYIRQAGYTLIELLLYVSIVGVLLMAVTAFYGQALDARIKNQSISEVDQQGMLALEQITQTIRNATAISAPAASATASSLTVTVPTGALSPTVFNLSGTTLQMTEGVGAAVPLTNGKVAVTALSFTNLTRPSTPGIVRVSITISRVNPNNMNIYDYSKTFTTSAALRWP